MSRQADWACILLQGRSLAAFPVGVSDLHEFVKVAGVLLKGLWSIMLIIDPWVEIESNCLVGKSCFTLMSGPS